MSNAFLQISDATTNQSVPAGSLARPMLLHGSEQSCASLMAAALIQAAVRREKPVVALSLRRSDIRTLQLQLGLGKPPQSGRQVDEPTMQAADEHLLVTLTLEKPDQLMTALRSLHDWQLRELVILGGEKTLTRSVWEVIQAGSELVVCGDFSHVSAALDLEKFQTRIGFSAWPKDWKIQRPDLPNYVGVEDRTGHQYVVLG